MNLPNAVMRPGLMCFRSKKKDPHDGRGVYYRKYFDIRRLLGELVEYVRDHDLLGLPVLRGVGGVDDYVKLKGIGPHRGISARGKSFWQVMIALIIGIFVYLYPDITTNLDVPFFKNLIVNLGPFFVFWVVLVVVGSCNAVNLTDGLDGLAIGSTLMVAFTMAILSYVTGNIK